MIDFGKAWFEYKQKMEVILLKKIADNTLIGNFNLRSNEKEYPLRARIGNMFIKITEQGGFIENSIHKYFNEINEKKNFNYNDFTFMNLLTALDKLEHELQYDLKETSITILEFGFNIDLGYNPSLFLANNLLMYKFMTPCYDPKNSRKMKIKKFIHDHYEFKIYNKSLESKLKGNQSNLLRIEVKYKSKVLLKEFGINSLDDLRNPQCIINLYVNFMKKYEQLIIVDSYDGNCNLSLKEKRFFTNCTNQSFWYKEKEIHCPNTVTNKKNKFKNMVIEKGVDNCKNHLRILIQKKFKELFNPNENLFFYNIP